jgi:hypothetical protein
MDNVAVIDFAGGNPSAELAMLPSDNTGLMVMRNGSSVRGTLHNIIAGDQVQWVNQQGQRNNIPIGEVSRLYLKPQSARASFFPSSNDGPSQAHAAPADAIGATIRVPGNQQWTDTFINVRSGDMIIIEGRGDINAGNNASAGVAGTPVLDQSRMPLRSAPGASLIGRIGNGAPFAIGWNPNPIRMPASGRLYLGINDDQVGDNTGEFNVSIRMQGARRGFGR